MLMFSLRFLLYPLENFDAVRRGVASYTPSQLAQDALVQLLGLPRASKPIFVIVLHTDLRRGDLLGLVSGRLWTSRPDTSG
jgi:hypothetical protein